MHWSTIYGDNDLEFEPDNGDTVVSLEKALFLACGTALFQKCIFPAVPVTLKWVSTQNVLGKNEMIFL